MLLLQNDCDMKTSKLKSCMKDLNHEKELIMKIQRWNCEAILDCRFNLWFVQAWIYIVQGNIQVSVTVTIITIYKCLKSNINYIEPVTYNKVWKKTNSKFKQSVIYILNKFIRRILHHFFPLHFPLEISVVWQKQKKRKRDILINLSHTFSHKNRIKHNWILTVGMGLEWETISLTIL